MTTVTPLDPQAPSSEAETVDTHRDTHKDTHMGVVDIVDH